MLTQEQFNESQQGITAAWHRGNLPNAFAEIDRVLRDGTNEMKGTALFYRAMIHESLGDWEKVREDSSFAIQFADSGSFLRYQLEHMIALSYEQETLTEEAIAWYRRALMTCAEGDDFSGHKALMALMRLDGDKFSQVDQALVARVIRKSWHALEVPGEPDLTKAFEMIERLSDHFSRTVEEIAKQDEAERPKG